MSWKIKQDNYRVISWEIRDEEENELKDVHLVGGLSLETKPLNIQEGLFSQLT